MRIKLFFNYFLIFKMSFKIFLLEKKKKSKKKIIKNPKTHRNCGLLGAQLAKCAGHVPLHGVGQAQVVGEVLGRGEQLPVGFPQLPQTLHPLLQLLVHRLVNLELFN